jgi:hypothetical protein
VFVELMPMLKERTLLITVARLQEKLEVNVIPARATRPVKSNNAGVFIKLPPSKTHEQD